MKADIKLSEEEYEKILFMLEVIEKFDKSSQLSRFWNRDLLLFSKIFDQQMRVLIDMTNHFEENFYVKKGVNKNEKEN